MLQLLRIEKVVLAVDTVVKVSVVVSLLVDALDLAVLVLHVRSQNLIVRLSLFVV
jgi:hypothetical protein